MPGPIKSVVSEMSEAVVKPVTDEVGKALEYGVQSVVGSTAKQSDPAAEQKKKVEEEKRRSWAIRVLEWNRQLEEKLRAVRDQKKQQEIQKQQLDAQQEQVKQYKIVEKKQMQAAQVREAQTRSEVKKGVGG